MPVDHIAVAGCQHLALGKVEPRVLQLSLDRRNAALRDLHRGRRLLRRSLRLHDAGYGLLNGRVCLLTFLRRLGHIELANGGLVRPLNVEGNLLLGFGQLVRRLRLVEIGLRIRYRRICRCQRRFGLFDVCLRRSQLRLDLLHRVFIRRRVNLQQQFAFLHRLKRLGVNRFDLPFRIGNELHYVLACHHFVRDGRCLRPDHHDAADHEYACNDHGRDHISRGLDPQDLEQHENDGNVDNDQKCDHGRVSLSEGLRSAVKRVAATSDSAALLGFLSSLTGNLAPKGVVNAQMNATGQSNPPVAIPIQLIAFIALACG